jgi:cell division septum initiation protein DivIVA
VRREKSQATPRPLVASAAERIGAIVEAAERAAESVIDDAEAQARKYLEETRAEAEREAAERRSSQAGLIASLLAEAEALREQAGQMVESLRRAEDALAGTPRSGDAPEARPEPARAAHLAAVADPEETRGGNLAGARLLATQMAVSGSSREEIEQRLKTGFEIEDPGAILDAILGPED